MFMEIHEYAWEKFWSLNLSVLFGSVLGEIYPNLTSQMGSCFPNTCMVSQMGYTTCFSVIEQRREYGLHMIKKYVKRNSIAEFRYFFEKKTDEINAFMDILEEKEILQEDFIFFTKMIKEYIGYYLVPRQVIDFIDARGKECVFEDLRKSRLYAEPIFGRINAIFCKYAEQLSQDCARTKQQCATLTIGELRRYFSQGNLPSKEVLNIRYEACAMLFDRSGFEMITERDMVNFYGQMHTRGIVDILKGTSAFAGVTRGFIRIVQDPNRCKKFDDGDILVTGMTRPEFLHLMKKSSAIVTDVGGLLCHAAIVAREIGKPCIVGTQCATSVLHDGDLVEVDANAGVVRILERAGEKK